MINLQLFAGEGGNEDVTFYSNDGLSVVFTGSVPTPTTIQVTATGVTNGGYSLYTYSGNNEFLGLASSANATTPTFGIGDQISVNGPITYYIVEATGEEYKKLTYKGSKVQVESAIRDGEGTKIHTNYAKKSELASKMDTTNPVGTGSLSINRKANTTVGSNSIALGYNNTASGQYSHAEGGDNTASGIGSHVEGNSNTASGMGSHAEGGNSNIASGTSSHVEGSSNTASGSYSHVEGNHNTGKFKNQHVFGEYCITDPASGSGTNRGTYIEIVGNGTGSNARSNARTLDWSGNEVLAGTLTALKFIGGLDYVTTAPTQANTNGLKIAVLSSEPATKYSGWIYLIKEE